MSSCKLDFGVVAFRFGDLLLIQQICASLGGEKRLLARSLYRAGFSKLYGKAFQRHAFGTCG